MMSKHDHVSNSLVDLGASLREQPSLKDRIMQRIAETDACQKAAPKEWYRSRAAKAVAGLAACLLVVLTVWKMSGHDGASQVFAAAMESVRRARTFSCKKIHKSTVDGQKRVSEDLVMFKEPNLERRVSLTGPFPQFNGKVTITDYAKRQRLRFVPAEKIAYLFDRSSSYVVEDSTGKLKRRELDTSIRDELLQWSKGDVEDQGDIEDLGRVELHGQSVRLLQSRWGVGVVKIWIDTKTKLPVQVAFHGRDEDLFTYTSIQIDAELDDDLFSLQPPDGYRLKKVGTGGWSDYQHKLDAKMAHLGLACHHFRSKHDGQFPKELSDLKTVGIKEEVIKVVLAAPGQPDGSAVIRYRRPPAGADFSTCVMLHEAFDKWPKDGLVACFADGHREIIVDQKHFEQLLR